MIKNVMMTLKKFDPFDLSQTTSLWNWIGKPSKMVLRIMKVWLLQQQPNLMWSKWNLSKDVKLNFAGMLQKLNDHRAPKEFPQNIGDDCFLFLGISAPSEWVLRASAETGQAFFDEILLKFSCFNQ